MELILISFIAGLLTALAPCVLPLMPVIVGSSLLGTNDRKRPYIIVVSLMVSLFLFTFLLKVSTASLGIPPIVWSIISGGIVIIFGIASVWPHLWEKTSKKLYAKSQRGLGKSYQKGGVSGTILMGAALGPVFSSCSPTYALILATVLPASLFTGSVALLAYVLGLGVFLLAVALLGRRLTSRLGWALNPEGWFKRGLGVVFIIFGLLIVTGYVKKVENYLVGYQLIDETKIEQKLLPNNAKANGQNGASNIPGTPQFALDKGIAAPELTGLDSWINSDPLTLASLKGKVVLIDFWTYSCINCIHTLPHVQGYYEKYKDQGLVVIGIHTPEFAFEHIRSNVAKAVKDEHITYPVALDNEMATWSAFSNQYWPAEYFIDRQGNVRHYHFGEGNYDENEKVIQALLREGGTKVDQSVSASNDGSHSADQSPETYLGNYVGSTVTKDAEASYSLPKGLGLNQWSLGGRWSVGAQDDVAGSGATLRYSATAKQVYLVMGGVVGSKVKVLVNGKPAAAAGLAGADVGSDSRLTIDGPRLYRLVKSDSLLRGAIIELQFDNGVTANAFTFDS
jgi:cytochrome c biogenesis protein CcdA/thiol-disulfide isomerase/thioredoxin